MWMCTLIAIMNKNILITVYFGYIFILNLIILYRTTIKFISEYKMFLYVKLLIFAIAIPFHSI